MVRRADREESIFLNTIEPMLAQLQSLQIETGCLNKTIANTNITWGQIIGNIENQKDLIDFIQDYIEVLIAGGDIDTSLSDFALKTDLAQFAKIDAIPKFTSQLINDVGYIYQIPEEYITAHDLVVKGYVTKDDLSGYISSADLDSKADADVVAQIQEQVAQIAAMECVSKTEFEEALALKADKADLDNYALKSEVTTTDDLDLYALKTDLNDYVQKDSLQNYALKSELNDYALLSELTELQSIVDEKASIESVNAITETVETINKNVEEAVNKVNELNNSVDTLTTDIDKANATLETQQTTLDQVNTTLEEVKAVADNSVQYSEYDNRKFIQLANYDALSGVTTTGDGANLIMMSKWDIVDIGSAKYPMNLNTDNVITINDEKVIATVDDINAAIAEIPETDLTEYIKAADVAETYATKADVNTALDTKQDAGDYVTQSIASSTGTAYVWNETSGGGARYDHTDGSRSFVGVNNGGADDIAVQIYAKNNSTNVGTRINIYNKGAYYIPNMSNTDAAYVADGEQYEIAVKGDIPSLDGYATTEYVDNQINENIVTVNAEIATKANAEDVYTKDESNTLLAEKATTEDLENLCVYNLGNFDSLEIASTNLGYHDIYNNMNKRVLTFTVNNESTGIVFSSMSDAVDGWAYTAKQYLLYEGKSYYRTVSRSTTTGNVTVTDWTRNDGAIYSGKGINGNTLFNLTTESTSDQVKQALTYPNGEGALTSEDLTNCCSSGALLRDYDFGGFATVTRIASNTNAFGITYVGYPTVNTSVFSEYTSDPQIFSIIVAEEDGVYSVKVNPSKGELLKADSPKLPLNVYIAALWNKPSNLSESTILGWFGCSTITEFKELLVERPIMYMTYIQTVATASGARMHYTLPINFVQLSADDNTITIVSNSLDTTDDAVGRIEIVANLDGTPVDGEETKNYSINVTRYVTESTVTELQNTIAELQSTVEQLLGRVEDLEETNNTTT